MANSRLDYLEGVPVTVVVGPHSFYIDNTNNSGELIKSGLGHRILNKSTDTLGLHAVNLTFAGSALGAYTLAAGYRSVANDDYSSALGLETYTTNIAQFVAGKYNVGISDTLFEVGIGSSIGVRKNGFEVYSDGTARLPEATIAEITARGVKSIPTIEWINYTLDNIVIPPSGVEEAPEDGSEYVRVDGEWEVASSGGIGEAPIDNDEYVRKNAGWVLGSTGGGGGECVNATATTPGCITIMYCDDDDTLYIRSDGTEAGANSECNNT